jgi:hypothetical protein
VQAVPGEDYVADAVEALDSTAHLLKLRPALVEDLLSDPGAEACCSLAALRRYWFLL